MGKVTVTQHARDAAARWAKSNSRSAQAANIVRGSCDTAPLVQQFARFEAETIARTTPHADLVEALREAIEWDGHDEMGEPAVWLEQARKALSLYGGEKP